MSPTSALDGCAVQSPIMAIETAANAIGNLFDITDHPSGEWEPSGPVLPPLDRSWPAKHIPPRQPSATAHVPFENPYGYDNMRVGTASGIPSPRPRGNLRRWSKDRAPGTTLAS